MIEYTRCQSCKIIHRQGELSFEWIHGTVNLRGSCPTCGSGKFEEVRHVCTECERHEAVKDDDFCQNCLDVEKDAIEDIRLETETLKTIHGDDFITNIHNILDPYFKRRA